jgi:bifunctional non-homologous end joining protein LigD
VIRQYDLYWVTIIKIYRLAAKRISMRLAKEFGFEGIVAKRRDSYYESSKRSGTWLKYRVNRGQELVIGGYVPGNPIESIIVGYYQDGRLLYAAKVRNGFVPHTRRAVATRLKGLSPPVHLRICPSASARSGP